MPLLTFDFIFDEGNCDPDFARTKIISALNDAGFTKNEEHCFRLTSNHPFTKIKVIPQSEQTRRAFMVISK